MVLLPRMRVVLYMTGRQAGRRAAGGQGRVRAVRKADEQGERAGRVGAQGWQSTTV